MTGAELAIAAKALTGTPFRLHGRDPRIGLDCIGVLDAACRACGLEVCFPNGYSLRSRRLPAIAPLAARLGLHEIDAPIACGDVILVRPSPCQYHFAIATGPDRFVHAHAGLRRVVEGPLRDDWPIIRQWRPHAIRN